MKVAYLAPEITGLSATFVYKEILDLEKNGYQVFPYSVHSQGTRALHSGDIENRVKFVYQTTIIVLLIGLCKEIICDFGRTKSSFRAVVSDLSMVKGITTKIKLIYQYLAGVWLATRLQDDGVEHLHIHFGHVPTQIGMYAALQSELPFTFTVHANDLFQRPMLYRVKADRAKKVIAISEFNITKLSEHDVAIDKVSVVRCGVNQNEFEFRPDLKWKMPYRICIVGRLVSKKGIDILIRAISELRVGGLEIVLEIAGDGPLKDSLTALVNELQLEESVIFIGKISNNTLPEWFSQQDIFVLPARVDENGDMDGIPVVLMEAMSCGIPVISTRISGIPELVENERTGILVEPDDPKLLATGIQRLIEDPDLREAVVTNALQIVRTEFSIKTNTRRLIEIFES